MYFQNAKSFILLKVNIRYLYVLQYCNPVKHVPFRIVSTVSMFKFWADGGWRHSQLMVSAEFLSIFPRFPDLPDPICVFKQY